jgi:DNA-binding NarL/FixJ family response regulator
MGDRHRGVRRVAVIENHAREYSTRILLVEDHASFRQALAFMFEREQEFVVTGQAGSLAEARAFIRTLPDGDGFELIEELASRPDVMTLVLSASLEPTRFARAVEAGAAGVLHKSAAIGEVVEAVRRLKSGEALLSPAEVIEMLRMVSRKRQEEYEAQRAIEKLTPREKQVLQALGEGLDSKDIAEKLHITVETERTHMVNILNKLDVHSRLQALVFAARHGLVEIS